MAFTTEFVMGAGGAEIEEIPVSMSGGGGSQGSPVVYPLATVDAGDGAFIALGGTLVPSSTNSSLRPYLQIGGLVWESPHDLLTGPAVIPRPGGFFTGNVQVAVQSRHSSGTTTFSGTVYVTRT